MAKRPKFKLIVEQREETTVHNLKATDEAQAWVESLDVLRRKALLPGDFDHEAERVTLVSAWEELPYDDWNDLAHERRTKETAARQREKELALLKRLEAKYRRA